MNAPKVDELDYIHFLVAAQRVFSTTEAARIREEEPNAPAHDAYTRLLKRIPPDTKALWREVSPFVKRDRGVLVVDDSTLDKPYAHKMALVTGQRMHLKGYGWVKVFKTVTPDGREEYWATSRLDMTVQEAAEYALDGWQIEVYHQGLKQFTGIERGQFRVAVAQRNHIGLAIRAFLRLEVARLQRGTTWFDAKHAIIREANRRYLGHPTMLLQPTA